LLGRSDVAWTGNNYTKLALRGWGHVNRSGNDAMQGQGISDHREVLRL
jgi:hypothetical protein